MTYDMRDYCHDNIDPEDLRLLAGENVPVAKSVKAPADAGQVAGSNPAGDTSALTGNDSKGGAA